MARQDEMFAVIESWRRSGKSRIAYARESGIAISTLQRWIKRVEQQSPPQTVGTARAAAIATPPRFVEIAEARPGTPRPPAPTGARAPRLRLELGDGVILTLY